VDGLRSLGLVATPIRAALPAREQRLVQLGLAALRLRPGQVRAIGLRQAVRVNQTKLLSSPTLKVIRDVAARASMRGVQVDGCIQYGTAFALPRGTRYVTYDDMTVVQATGAYPYEWITRMAKPELEYLVTRQRRIFRDAHACCAATHWAAESIIRDYGVPAERVRVVGFGATNLAPEVPDRDWSTPRFLFVGKDWTRKNGDAILAAFAAVRHAHPAATLDLVGGHPAVDQPGVTGHGLLEPGAADSGGQITSLLASATCFVMPSLHEPAGIAYVEAGSAGVGSVGSLSGGSSTMIGDGGLVVDPRDRAAIVDAMMRFADGARAQEFGIRAARRAKLFTWSAVARRLAEALHGVSTPQSQV
jgi:glycosyltransferase involved in cell wall biosynthesis